MAQIGSGAWVTVLTGALYAWLIRRLPLGPLLIGMYLLIFVSAVALRLGLTWSSALWLVFVLLIWDEWLACLMEFSFWRVAGLLFTVRQGKRLFNLVSSGGWRRAWSGIC